MINLLIQQVLSSFKSLLETYNQRYFNKAIKKRKLNSMAHLIVDRTFNSSDTSISVIVYLQNEFFECQHKPKDLKTQVV